MANIRPFNAFRPKKGMEDTIAALPYDVYNRQEACDYVKDHPDSFLAIDRPETQFSMDTDMYSPQVYEKAKEMLLAKIANGSFVKDEKPCYYLYEQVMNGRSQTGIVACASIDDYMNNVIKKHENTRADKEADRIRHVDVCNTQTGPIFLAYRSQDVLKEMIALTKKKAPVYNFTSEDNVTHIVYVIDEDDRIAKIKEAFDSIPAVYIADGHHRCASAVKVGQKRREENPGYTGEEEFNYFLSVLFPDEELKIMDYNRVVKDLNGLSEAVFLEKVTEKFEIAEVGKTPYAPETKGTFGMLLGDTWYKLSAKDAIKSEDAVDGLDVSVLQNHLLGPILGIQDPKTDKRIDFVGGIRGLGELKKRVDTDMKIAFSMYPTSIQELFRVADAGRLMPPKSTWFEPKLRSGLFLHALD